MVEGESGLLSIFDDSELRGGSPDTTWNRSMGELFLANGSRFKVFSRGGPSEAARQTGIAKQRITQWAKVAGVRTSAPQRTAEATKMRRLQGEAFREEVKEKLLRRVDTALELMVTQTTTHVGQQGKEVTYERPPAQDFRHYAMSAGILVDKFRLESGESTSKTEHVNQTEFDAEVKALTEKVRTA